MTDAIDKPSRPPAAEQPSRPPAAEQPSRPPAAEQASRPPAAPSVRHYHVALTPKQILARLSEQPGVKAYDKQALPDFAGLIEDSEYTLELGPHDFRIYCGPPIARGQSGTGMLKMLYLVGRMTATEQGTAVELRFAWHRPRWAMQRWIGFLALASLGLVWVIAGPGLIAKKALLYGLLLVVVAPVLAHDLRRDDKHDEQRRLLLNLMEHVFGPLQIADTPADEPYRKRLREGQDDEDEDDEDRA
jgi:hypothetical protein